MINDSLGYIKLDRFARNSYREFRASLQALKRKGMATLILDLRGNGGGFIDIANRIVDEFLEDEKRIVFTRNNKNEITESFATENGIFENGDVYVLIDENSASASEILAGALQDNDKGTIVGRRSFGKGLVQQEMDLGDGSAVRLTIARYYTPTGRSIQKPYRKNGDDAYTSDFQQRVRSGELSNKDSIPVVDSLKYTTPKGKIVYGGGGIIPDVFVPIDTTSYMNNFYFIAITNFAFEYVDRNRRQIAEKWTLETFITHFDSDARVYDEFYAKIKEFNPSIKAQKILQKYLKSSIANEIFGDVGFYRMQHKDDKMILKVLELENQQE
jgi:carboxyl-terminal processing protease